MTCRQCKNLCDCEDDAFRHEVSFDLDCSAEYCTGFEPMTNADRIRAMTDEELAELLSDDDRACPPKHPNCKKYVNSCKGCFLEWLQQPAEEKEQV